MLSLAAQSALSCTKNMRWNDDPPFTFIDQQNPGVIQGMSVDITRQILSALGCELNLIKMPWARALISIKEGNIDILSGAYNTQERRDYAHFSTTGLYSPNILFVRKNETERWSFTSLKDIVNTSFILGVQINVSYSQESEKLKDQADFISRLHQNSSRQSLWRMLALNRVDGVIADKMTGLAELKELGLKNKVTASQLIVSNEPSFFAFSKKNIDPKFVEQFDAEFSKLLNNGEIKRIEDFYLNR